MSEPATSIDLGATEVDLLVLDVAGERVAVGAAGVSEILEGGQATRLPDVPDFVEGVLMVRDIVAPLIDLRMRLSAEGASQTSQVLLTRPAEGEGGDVMAVRVDRVLEILHCRLQEIEPPPDIGSAVRYLLGVVRLPDGVAPLLDLEELCTTEERLVLAQLIADLRERLAQGSPSLDAGPLGS